MENKIPVSLVTVTPIRAATPASFMVASMAVKSFYPLTFQALVQVELTPQYAKDRCSNCLSYLVQVRKETTISQCILNHILIWPRCKSSDP